MSLLRLGLLFMVFPLSLSSSTLTELQILLQIKSSLDPGNRVLTSWELDGDPCGTLSFEGVACNDQGHVANISLQGIGLSGSLPAAVGGLKSLTGLYLHFNDLTGNIPKEIGTLTLLTDLYLNVNQLSGEIPPEIGNITSLQVLQVCYNNLGGSIPTQLGSLEKISTVALQYNHLKGAIPASLGGLATLSRLDLSFNDLFGPIPVKLADAPMLQVLDIRNNSLSGIVPTALKRLKAGFQYSNNPGLCGVGFSDLNACAVSDKLNPNRSEPVKPNGPPTFIKPESAELHPSNCRGNASCSKPSKGPHVVLIIGVIGLITFLSVFTFSWYRRQKQKIESSIGPSNERHSSDLHAKEISRREGASTLISLEYATRWDPLALGQNGNGFSKEFFESFMFNLEDVERATQCFSEVNLLGKSNFSALYKGMLRDGSAVAIKCIAKRSCKSDESECLKGLKILTLLNHENLVRLRGFCCSKGRGECFLIYDFVPNGNLLQYLDVKEDNGEVLEWPTRVSIVNGIARGIVYLHGQSGNKPAIVHQNISAEKVMIDHWYNPWLADSGLCKLLTDDIVFSKLKASAAMGYLAPEYITTGRFTEKSDVYAFGMIILQVLSGKSKITHLTHQALELGKARDFMDPKLEGKFPEAEAVKIGRIGLRCTNESPSQRPSMENVVHELSNILNI